MDEVIAEVENLSGLPYYGTPAAAGWEQAIKSVLEILRKAENKQDNIIANLTQAVSYAEIDRVIEENPDCERFYGADWNHNPLMAAKVVRKIMNNRIKGAGRNG